MPCITVQAMQYVSRAQYVPMARENAISVIQQLINPIVK